MDSPKGGGQTGVPPVYAPRQPARFVTRLPTPGALACHLRLNVWIQPIRFERSPKLHAMLTENAHPVNSRVVVQGKRGPEVATVRGEAAPENGGRYGMILQISHP